MWIQRTSNPPWSRRQATIVLVLLGVASFCGAHFRFAHSTKIRSVTKLPQFSNPTNPELLLAEADRFAWLSNWPEAASFYSRAEDLFNRKGDTRNEIYARIGLIWAQSETTSVTDASEMLRQELNSSIVASDSKLKLRCLAALGYSVTGINLHSAKLAWSEAQRISKSVGDARWESRLTGELGILAFMEGDSRQAARMMGRALWSATAAGDAGTQIRDLEMLGNGFEDVKRYAEAIAIFDHVIKLARGTPGAGFPFMAYEGKAAALIGLGKLHEATELLNHALGVARDQHNKAHQTQLLVILGEEAVQAGDSKNAIRCLEEAGIVGQQYGSYYPISQAMFDLAQLYRALGNLKLAEERAAIGLEAERHLGNRYYLPRAFTTLADLKTEAGQYAEADHLYEQAEDVIDGILNSLAEPYWNSSLADAWSETYLHHFTLAARRGEVRRALNVIERIRGRTAAAALENRIQSSSDSPEVHSLKAKVSELQVTLMHSDDFTKRSDLMSELIEYERRLDWATLSRQEWFETPASIKQIQSTLRPDELVLEYVLDEPQAYCLWISKTGAAVEPLSAGRQRIEQLTHNLLEQVRSQRDAAGIATELYAVLFPPAVREQTQTTLVVVPDGFLHLLPFEILRGYDGGLLVESRTISYVPAATVLHVLRSRKNLSSPRPFLGVGDAPYENQGKVSTKLESPRGLRNRILRQFSNLFGMPLYDLPHTRQEVLDISNIAGKDSVTLLGREATETAFKSEPLAEFRVIHLATHGYVDSQFPERSGLVLGRDPASQDDGLLQVREIMQLRFNAELVTLSACDTGVGKLQGEEGITNLPEAFLVSGARAVVASLWSADDAYTLKLMENFYAHLADGLDKASALRQAKLDLLATYGSQAQPYYWGGFVLVGDGASPVLLGH